MAKKRVLRIRRPALGGQSYVVDHYSAAAAEVEACFEFDEPGDKLVIELEEMEEEEYAALPEFKGW